MALKHSIIEPSTAIEAASVESDFQESQWGTISESHDTQRESMKRHAYLATLLMKSS
jgi:chaperone required for assembly of F1-ATPase